MLTVVANSAQMRVGKTTLDSQGIFLKTGIVIAKKRVNLFFLRGCCRREMMTMMKLMMKCEPQCHHKATATLTTEKFFLRTQYV